MKPLLLLAFIFVALIAGVSIMRSRAVPHGIGAEPEIISFNATPTVVQAGEPVTLAWRARGANSLTLSQSSNERGEAGEPERTRLPGTGQIVVHPSQDTVYRLTCETADGPMCTTAVTTVRAK